MGFNIYKEIPKIREKLAEEGYKKNIPVDLFGKTFMMMFGMKKQTVRKWVSYFEENNIIKIKDGVVNFL